MTRRALVIALVALWGQSSPHAQLAQPAGAGVVLGHLHLTVRDIEAQQRFWLALGGTAVQNGPLRLIQFPGVYIMLRQGEPTGGTVGSVMNHFGFSVQNLKEATAKYVAAGLKVDPAPNPIQAFVQAPDDIRVELTEIASIAEPIRMHHLHWNTAAISEMQAWYAKHFNAVPGKRNQFEAADLPGINLTFGKGDASLVATKGRALDHIGFEVKNLKEFVAKLEASGIKMDAGYRTVPNTNVGTAFLTDPWGTYIELTENLAPLSR